MNTSLNFGKMMSSTPYEGAGHGDDIGYLFRANVPFSKAPSIDSKEFALIKQMVSIVASFIIDGKPSYTDDGTEWEPITKSDPLECVNITNDSIEVIPLPEQARMKVWDEILEDANVPLY